MKRIKLASILVIFFTLSFGIYAHVQEDPSDIKNNIDLAFENYKMRDSLLLDPELEQELKQAYYEEITALDPKNFFNQNAAKHLINFYSQPEGIEDILRDWIKATELPWANILSIDEELWMRVHFGSKNPKETHHMKSHVPNKYATLVVNNKPSKKEADIYLNGKFISSTKEAKKGIRVYSGKPYKLQLKRNRKTYCETKIILDEQEVQTQICKAN